ncbi:MAG: hypothetical protein J7K72_01140 [Candidatus Aenigmarchaeota archaeon]|nr:hypothetical protein [Candidatus Aenigmarchaeota archaeon]
MKVKPQKTYEIKFYVKRSGTVEEAKQEILDEMFKRGIRDFEVKEVKEPRSLKQNNSIHLFCEQLADELNRKGITAQQMFKKPVEEFWTPVIVKEMWHKIQKSMFGKKSTTQLFRRGEINKIWEVFNKMVSERTDGEAVCPPFPNYEGKNQKTTI